MYLNREFYCKHGLKRWMSLIDYLHHVFLQELNFMYLLVFFKLKYYMKAILKVNEVSP